MSKINNLAIDYLDNIFYPSDMTSPFVENGKVVLKFKQSFVDYKNINISYQRMYYQCVETGAHFTTTELDEHNLESIKLTYNQEKFNQS